MTSTLSNPAAWAAAVPMKVFPVPISPTMLVPGLVLSESAAALMASSWAPRGFLSRSGSGPSSLAGW